MNIDEIGKIFEIEDTLPIDKNEKDLAEEIGNMVVELRIINNLTQNELAEKVGTKQPGIARLENGSSLPSLKTLFNIAKVLGTYLISPKFGAVENYDVTLGVNEKTINDDIHQDYKSIKMEITYSSTDDLSEKTNLYNYNNESYGKYVVSSMQ